MRKTVPNLCAQGGGLYLHHDAMLMHFMNALKLSSASQNHVQKIMVARFPEFNYWSIKDGNEMREWLKKAESIA